VADIQNGYAFSSSVFKSDTGIPVIKIKNVASGNLRMDEVDYYQLLITENIERFVIKNGDILIAMTGSHINQPSSMVGKVARYDLNGIALLNQRVSKLFSLDKNILNEDFLYYFLKQEEITYELALNAGGSANQANISPELIKALDFLLPPISEQKAIASVLSSLDDKIDLLHRQNKTLEAMAEAIFRRWFIEEADEEWEECTLNDLCTQIASGGTPSTKIEAYYNGDINWYTTKELNDNFLYESENKIAKAGLDNSSAKLFPAGTVVIAIYAAPTVGRLGILATEASFNQAACGLIANEELCCSEFIYLYLKNQRNELNLMASGSAQQNLNVGKITSYPAVKVPKDLMNKFKEVIQPIFKKINNSESELHTLEKLRDTLLPKLMSGEVRVKFTDSEVQR